MATVSLKAAIAGYQWWPDFFQPNDPLLVNSRTSSVLKWTNPDGSSVELRGTGFVYDSGEPVEGSLTGITVRNASNVIVMTITGLSASVVDAYFNAFGYERPGQSRQDGDGFLFVSSLLNGNDIINGSNNSDDIVGGRSAGNDTITANGGDDFIKGDAGNDSINGGADYDTLTYQESFYDYTAFQGITADLTTKTVIDCWGGTDTFVNIEQLKDSRFADTFLGTVDNDFWVSGLRGADTINGGLGWDEIVYWDDYEFGGLRGINVNLATGRIIDGFGNRDTVSGFESVIGTTFDDRFVGSSGDDQFLGGDGADSYNGGLGFDTVNFSHRDEEVGAVVDLRLTTGQVLNDGFGNVETLVSIENLDGNPLNDTLFGNNASNRLAGDRGDDILQGFGGADTLQGDQGADTLSGGTGADVFYYERREGNDPWGDTITDFVSGSDSIAIRFGDFAGMSGSLQFTQASALASGDTGSWFYYNVASDDLFWDVDGFGGAEAIQVAHFTNNVTLVATDIDLVT